MIGKIVWEKSGDEISFTPIFPDLLVYYTERLNRDCANCFQLRETKFDPKTVDDLEYSIKSVKKLSDKIPFLIDDQIGDLLDQNYLNTLHYQWVKTGLKYPALPVLLRQMNGMDQTFRDINKLLHRLENSFQSEFVNYHDDPYQIDNIFGSSILSFDIANLSIGFDNLGRSSWEKFLNFDNNATDVDTNDFKKISGQVTLVLRRPISSQPPQEYIDWCSEHDVPVVGKTLNLGNIIDLDKKLNDIRKIIVRNVHEQNDRFFFETRSI